MKVIRVSKPGPTTKGQVKTSQKPITRAAPQRATKQSSVIAGGYPINFGVGGKSTKKAPMKARRRGGMY